MALVCGVVMTAGLIAVIAALLWRARNMEIAAWRTNASHSASVVATHARQSFKGAEMALAAIVEHLQIPLPGLPADPRARLATPETRAMMSQYIGGVPQIGYIGLLDATGMLVNTSNPMPATPMRLADRDYFIAAMQPDFKGVFISAPVQSRADGSWTFYLAAQISAADAPGQAAHPVGVLVAGMHVAFFEDFYRTISLGDYSTTLLLRRDGTLLVRDPPAPGALGASFVGQPVMQVTGPTSFITDVPRKIPQQGVQRRIIAVAPVEDLGLIAAIAVGEDLYLARWTRGASIAAAAISVICLALLVLTWAVRRLLTRAESQASLLQDSFAEIHASQASLREKTRLLDLTLDHMDQGILLITADKRLPLMNRRALELLDLPAEFASGTATFEQLQAYQNARNEFAKADETVRPALQSSEVFALADLYTRTRPNGVVLEIHTRPLPDGGLIRSYTDITRRISTEAKLRQAQRMEAVGQLTAGIAHDFNNILGIIVGNLELVTDQVMSDPDAATQFASEAREATMLAAGLVRRLLAFSRLQAMQPQPTDLAAMLEATRTLLRQAVAGHLEIDISLPADLWAVRIDTPQLQNALINLAANARAAAPVGSTLGITAANHTISAERDTETGLPAGDYVRISVRDAGVGMSEETRARVFEPFFTTQPVGSGSGLGLSMVLGTLQQMGGTVRIDSAEGQGTTVHLFVPRA